MTSDRGETGEGAMEFLQAAQNDPEHYGRNGLRAFMAAHHANCHISQRDMSPCCAVGWDLYNDQLDLQRAMQKEDDLCHD